MRRRMSFIAAAALAAVPALTVSGQAEAADRGKVGSYIVVMKADPLVRGVTTRQLGSPDAKARRNSMHAEHAKVVAAAGLPAQAKVVDYTNALNGFSVRATAGQAAALGKQADVAVVLRDEMRQKAADRGDDQYDTQRFGSIRVGANGLYDFLGLDGRGEAWSSGLTGEGVTVGVIDTGIWPEHPSFADDGSYPAHAPLDATGRSACAFGNTAHNPNDAAFTCTNKLVGARVFLDTYKAQTGLTADEFDSARDDDGHGTHTASTAAGNRNVPAFVFGAYKGRTSGIAPRAQIIAYKALGDGGGYTSDLVAAIDQAVADGVQVINYSVGGGAATVSPDTLAFLFAADAGVYAAVSAGNNGPGPKTIGGPADVPWVTAVGANTHPTFYQGLIVAGGLILRGASITRSSVPARFVDAATAGNELCLGDSLDPAKVKGAIVVCKRGGNGRIAKSAEVQRAGGVGMVLYNAVDVDTLFSDNFFVPTVMIDNAPGLQLKAWIAKHSAYPIGMLINAGVGSAPFYSPTMAYFSSRGENPTAGDIIKPDITAPGVQILAGATPFPTPGSEPAGQLFQAIAGTSMSSPVVAGEYALLRQAHPDWSPAMAKSALMTTAYTKVRDNDRVSQAGPFAMGAGMARVGLPAAAGSAFQPGLVYDAGFTEYLGVLCAEGREAFRDAVATCGRLAAAGVPTRASDLNLASIGVEALPGTTTVTRSVTSVADRPVTYTARVEAPAGFRVTVTPSTLTLAPGASASFQVAITNDGSAPLGAWRSGSLTWVGGNYRARSPIAVKAVALASPARVTGTGASGSVDIPVQFGVAGAYTATAEGLIAATHTAGTVAQDPDQTYPSADDGAGVVKLPYTLSGVGVARWALDLPGETDIDLYLLGPDGKEVARSAGGGTHELIELQAPADGSYTLVVHGWAVGATPLAFDVRSWLVLVDDGAGSLSVTAGGSVAATVGASHTVTVGWSGLSAGESYLGAVTHRNGTSVLARTVVAVTT